MPKIAQQRYSQDIALALRGPGKAGASFRSLFVFELIPQDGHGKNKGDPVGQVNRHVFAKDSVEEPHERAKSKKGVHDQRDAGGIFCADGFYCLWQKRDGCTKCGDQTGNGNKLQGHRYIFLQYTPNRANEGLVQFLELAGLPVFADVVPVKKTSVHRHIDPGWQGLCEGQCAPQVEKTVRAAEFIGNHSPCQDDGFSRHFFRQRAGRHRHRIRTMSDDNFVFASVAALVGDQLPVLIRHVQAVDHHERPDSHFQRAAAALQHFGEVGLLKEEFSR